jgi:Rps23 Pro-64 3,4-dihydroxylase Tpa1-like proline 4-hydroxylase
MVSVFVYCFHFKRCLDLNSLSQTIDLKSFDVEGFPYLCGFRKFMATKVHDFLKRITGFELNTQVAITGSKYSHTDLLLPHDDSLDFRKIAFVLYLTPDWKDVSELLTFW